MYSWILSIQHIGIFWENNNIAPSICKLLWNWRGLKVRQHSLLSIREGVSHSRGKLKSVLHYGKCRIPPSLQNVLLYYYFNSNMCSVINSFEFFQLQIRNLFGKAAKLLLVNTHSIMITVPYTYYYIAQQLYIYIYKIFGE